jgi:hypothetical protein
MSLATQPWIEIHVYSQSPLRGKEAGHLLMKKRHIGKLPPKYKFILNQYQYERISSCPFCKKQTHARKFPLFIHVNEWGPVILGKTCKYCSRCELIVAHRHEIDEQLTMLFGQIAPECVGNDYLVVGTVERKFWKQETLEKNAAIGETLNHMADFRKVYDLHIRPAGWYPKDEA